MTVEARSGRHGRMAEDARHDEQILSRLEQGGSSEVAEMMPRQVREADPFAGRVIPTNDVPSVERGPNPRREHESVVVPSVPGAQAVLELSSALLADGSQCDRWQMDRPARAVGLGRCELLGPNVQRVPDR